MDLQYVPEVARTVGRHMDDYRLVVDKSTATLVRLIRQHAIADELKQRGVDLPYSVASNPEFLKEGDAVSIGEVDRIDWHQPRAEKLSRTLCALIATIGCSPWMCGLQLRNTRPTPSAATKISFMNEMANIAEMLAQTSQSAGSVHLRIGYRLLSGWWLLVSL